MGDTVCTIGKLGPSRGQGYRSGGLEIWFWRVNFFGSSRGDAATRLKTVDRLRLQASDQRDPKSEDQLEYSPADNRR